MQPAPKPQPSKAPFSPSKIKSVAAGTMKRTAKTPVVFIRRKADAK